MAFYVPGPCTITYDTQSFLTTKEGVIIRPRVNWKELVADVTGVAPSGFLENGRGCTVECSLCNFTSTNLAQLSAKCVDGLGSVLASSNGNIGALMSALKAILVITEADASAWTASYAMMLDPTEIPLMATQDLVIPIMFIIIPDGGNDLFTSIPTYIEDQV